MKIRNSTLLLAAAAALAGCSEEETPVGSGRYAVATSILGDNPATYVKFFDSLDEESFALDDALEYGGYASIAAHGGKLFVGAGEAPTITRYGVAEGELVQEGEVNFGSWVATAPLYRNVFLGETRAYLHRDETHRVIWNPSTMQIEGEEPAPAGIDPLRGDLTVRSAYDRGVAVRDGYVFQPFYFADGDYYRFDGGSQIAVYSQADDSLVDVIEVPCPGMDVVSQDEAGNLYFSNWVFPTAADVLDEEAPAVCTVRIKAGELTLDEEWDSDVSALVGDRVTAGFRYLGDGVALVAALDEDSITINEDTVPGAISYGSVFRLWRVNLENGSAEKIEGLSAITGGYYAFEIDGRTFLSVTSADYATTTFYELGLTGVAEKRFAVDGWAYQLVDLGS